MFHVQLATTHELVLFGSLDFALDPGRQILRDEIVVQEGLKDAIGHCNIAAIIHEIAEHRAEIHGLVVEVIRVHRAIKKHGTQHLAQLRVLVDLFNQVVEERIGCTQQHTHSTTDILGGPCVKPLVEQFADSGDEIRIATSVVRDSLSGAS